MSKKKKALATTTFTDLTSTYLRVTVQLDSDELGFCTTGAKIFVNNVYNRTLTGNHLGSGLWEFKSNQSNSPGTYRFEVIVHRLATAQSTLSVGKGKGPAPSKTKSRGGNKKKPAAKKPARKK